MQKLYSQIIVATILFSGCTFTRPEHVSIEQTSESEYRFNQQVLDKLKIYGYNTEKLKPMFTTVKKMWTVTIKDGVIVNYNS